MLLPRATTQSRGYSPPLTECAPSTNNFTDVETMPGGLTENNADAVKYLGVEHLLDVACRQYDSLDKLETEQQILKFQSVQEKDFDILSADDTRPCKFVRFQYHRPTKLLLVKVMPGWDHEGVVALIRKLVDKELDLMDVDEETFSWGSPRNELGDWSKEPDACWAPALSSDKPTCVVGVGTSESESYLSIDARRWLEAPQSPVQVVITISFKYLCAETDENPLHISVWKRGRGLSNVSTRNSVLPAVRTAHLDVWNIGGYLSVSGVNRDVDAERPVFADGIVLPLELFIGRPPMNPKEHDIVITPDKLFWIMEKLWRNRRIRGISQ
ncbi:unnamed protein product [Penicillium nalgiovense]|nr:unnamed protein product [Penicillium nalgiovense]